MFGFKLYIMTMVTPERTQLLVTDWVLLPVSFPQESQEIGRWMDLFINSCIPQMFTENLFQVSSEWQGKTENLE